MFNQSPVVVGHMAATVLSLGLALVPSALEAQAPAVLEIATRNYAFEAPDTVPAGVTTIRMRNEGPELHHVLLARITQGKTMDDVRKLMAHGGPPPSWIVESGGPNAAVPGAESNATVDLLPGTYIITCVIPSPDGKPHFMKGMVRELTVVPSKSTAKWPAADVELTLFDYNFAFSKPITAGPHTIKFANTAAQAHEAVLVRLAPGKTAQDFLAWAEKMAGPPPATPIGGIVGLIKGQTNLITVDFTPGNYALVCFVPDSKDGKPHVAHGMFKEFKVE